MLLENRLLKPKTRQTLSALSAVALALASACAQAQMPGRASPEAMAEAALNPVVVAGDSWIVSKTTLLKSLTLEPGAAVAAPAGKSLTMTVDGVETTLLPGRYRGRVVLTVGDEHVVRFSDLLAHRFRQALFLDASGVVAAKSVADAAGPYTLSSGMLSGARIRSKGQNFNGVLVAGGRHTVKYLVLDFEGNGGNDFAGYGAGVMSDGKDTRLVLDNARIRTQGAVRTAVVCAGGSQMLVKNSQIQSLTGTLPADYVSNVMPGEMKDAPWMLGIKGNVRATNVLGDGTRCTYLNSTLSADGWGVLSVDASQNAQLTAINSRIDLTGVSGYGSYAIGNSTNRFYGSVMNVPTHGIIITGGHAVFGASTAQNLTRLNTELQLELSAAELEAIKPAQTLVNSRRYGVMTWGDATVKIADGTVFNTGEAVFLNKGATVKIDVDGSQGAQLNPANGVIFQAIDNDDPGPDMAGGRMANTGVYREPTTPPTKVAGFDLAAQQATDMVARFSNIRLKGNFYNAIRSKMLGGGFGPEGPSKEPPVPSGANLVLGFDRAELTGVITASTARHLQATITAADYQQLGRVRNTPAPAVNNGVIVALEQSTWTVTGTSYLTRLTIGPGAQVRAAAGRRLVLKVDGVVTPLKEGSYQGALVLQVLGG